MNLKQTMTTTMTAKLNLLFSCVLIFAGLIWQTASARAAESPTGGLVAAWNFDEPTGEQAMDVSGHRHHGTLRGATCVKGKFGGAIECKQDALVEVPYTAMLNDFKDGLTVSAWVKRDADTTWNTVMSREVKNGPSEYFGLAVVKNKALFSVDPDGAHYQNIKSEQDIPVGEWIHLAGTYNNETFKLYVNGHLVKSASCSIPFRFHDQNPIIIGGNTNTQGKKWVDCFHGRIDEVRLYRQALSEEDVLAIMAANGSNLD
jgi:Concanavalin A-like lectin/glucanases superfamily